jgi:hypothetical protein
VGAGAAAGGHPPAEAIKVLARAHQSMGRMRGQQANQLRSTLRQSNPAALIAFEELISPDALAVLRSRRPRTKAGR